MIVVSDISPIVNLAFIGQLDLLRRLYNRVVIPQAVDDEIAKGSDQSGIAEIRMFDWIEIKQVTNQAMVASLELELDRGEAEAIALAIELKADLLLLDERKGRLAALRLGVRIIGLLGLVIEAKQKGLIPFVKPTMDALKQKAGFWISQDLYDHILQVAGE